MSLSFALQAAVLALAGTAVAQPAPAGRGSALYVERCQTCHESDDERVPPLAHLRALPAATISANLTTGPMAPMVTGLSKAEVAAIIAYLTTAPKP